ncbi:acetyltransferase [Tetragenococcus halophilus subsp. flandriensis]|uniref:GNAT family N-acetyltransferase n=1 Tax=Tetragenococcus halophilus TaxID=51669 RepID=UPI0023E9B632|nr:GNAT family N-acetyltransferase [Tetragenococcus halophilus]GMA08275.1 acetyltransferase [Tetragenococcus halophilus subsp. flandriensis]
MYIRNYTFSDKKETLEMIKQTIQEVNKNDYSKEQLDAWSSIDEYLWTNSLKDHSAILMISNKIIGFADMDNDGYLDRLFVHKDFQNQTIASKLVNYLEKSNRSKKFSTFASITAKPFFIARGYKVIRKNTVNLRGEQFKNYYMEKINENKDSV